MYTSTFLSYKTEAIANMKKIQNHWEALQHEKDYIYSFVVVCTGGSRRVKCSSSSCKKHLEERRVRSRLEDPQHIQIL